MVVGGSQQETLDPGFVLLGTRQQGTEGTGVPWWIRSRVTHLHTFFYKNIPEFNLSNGKTQGFNPILYKFQYH
ncbi:unnamed protein product [Schistosoma curassoni]|uniref:Ovule protein n=1 Tax=Schistosoma curassoni TaxID=6186 RepID=A0A183K8A9_9TREM|nr:unnamed protein product [Schistosoma curassoni]